MLMSEKGIKRMSASQCRSATSLIKNICANYDNPTGLCLPLDTRCPQMITDSVICKHFRNVLLEDKDGKVLRDQIYQPDNIRRCEVCGQPFQALSNRARFCAKCSQKRRLQKQREYMAKQRLER
jgi:hypothetical protein